MKNKLIFVSIVALICTAVIFYSCNKKEPVAQHSLTASQTYDTITSLTQMYTAAVIWNNHGDFILVELVDGDLDNENELNRTEAGCSNNFTGSARATAKKSFSTSSYVNYPNIAGVRATLQTDNFMLSLGITNSSNRVTYENRNVSVTSAYLFAIARESDNDYHLIIGDTPANGGTLYNCESSGLPSTSSSSYAAISAVRTYLKSYFGTDFCGVTGYTRFTPPIATTMLKGSLFFDIDHLAGTVGPAGLRPNTAWEMHPINSIHF